MTKMTVHERRSTVEGRTKGWNRCDLNRVTIEGDVARLYLTDDVFALVDVCDVVRVRQFKWSLARRANRRYAQAKLAKMRGGDGRVVLLHSFLLPRTSDVRDHANGNGLDNRSVNLRSATWAENAQNGSHHRVTGSSRFRGVSWLKRRGRWRVQIKFRKVTVAVGYFDDEMDAALAYNIAAQMFHGKFAVLNDV